MIRASIDLGTNTCLLLVADCDPSTGEARRVIADQATVVRLGQGVDRNRSFLPEAMDRTLACLSDYAGKARAAGAKTQEAVCIATSQARDSKNAAEFFFKVEQATGFRFRVVSGDEEARYTFLGALLPGMDPAYSAVIDIGGGSTELISARGGQSVDVGSVRFTERYLPSDPVKDDEFWKCQDEIDRALESLKPWRAKLSPDTRLVAVAGTATSIAAIHLALAQFDAARIDGCDLARGDVHRVVEELKWRSVEERLRMPGMEAGRADVLLAGSLILWRAMEVLGFGALQVSTRGLRFGALLK